MKVGTDMTFKVGVIVGSLSKDSINGRLAKALKNLAPDTLEFVDIPIGTLPLYNRDLDGSYPPVAVKFKELIAQSDALLYVTPEYNRSIPGTLKNAIDWASRPYGHGVLGRPSAVIGASGGNLSTAVGQQHLKQILLFMDAPQMGQPEGYLRFTPDLIDAEGNVSSRSTEEFLTSWMGAFSKFVEAHS